MKAVRLDTMADLPGTPVRWDEATGTVVLQVPPRVAGSTRTQQWELGPRGFRVVPR